MQGAGGGHGREESACSQGTANQAQGVAGQAQTTADGAQTSADQAQTTANQTSDKIANITEVTENTVTLSDGGSQELLTIGDVTLDATCDTPISDLSSRILASTEPGADGQLLIVDAFTTTLAFDSADLLVATLSGGAVTGEEVGFAILDGASTARGIAAVSADQIADECQATAHVVR